MTIHKLHVTKVRYLKISGAWLLARKIPYRETQKPPCSVLVEALLYKLAEPIRSLRGGGGGGGKLSSFPSNTGVCNMRPAKPFSAALVCSTARLNQVQICCWDNHRRGPKRKSRQPRPLLVWRFLSSRSTRFMFNIHEEFVTLGLYSYRSTGD